MNWKSRIRNKAFWLSTAAFVALLAKSFKVIEIPSDYDIIVNTALGLLVGMGVLIDPTTPGIKD